jgi:hypothetical protein
MNTLVNTRSCPMFKQDNGDQYMVYNEIDGKCLLSLFILELWFMNVIPAY